jgi:hypothetical protein
VPVRRMQEERSAFSFDAERALLRRVDRSTLNSYDRTSAALQPRWTRFVTTSLVVLNHVSQLPIKNLEFPHSGEDGRCIALPRSRASPKRRARDKGRGGAAARWGLSFHVYPDPSANRTRACTDQVTLSLAFGRTTRKQQADTDGCGCAKPVAFHEAGLG